MSLLDRVRAFFLGFGFAAEQASALAARFGDDDEALRRARAAVTHWLTRAGGAWAGESPAGFAAARAAFVRARLAERCGPSFLTDDIPSEIQAALTAARLIALPSLVPSSMVPQDVRMLPVIDDVLCSVLPLAPKRS